MRKLEEFIGKNYEEVSHQLTEQKIKHRLAKKDGESFMLTKDMVPHRYNFYVENGIIVRCTMG